MENTKTRESMQFPRMLSFHLLIYFVGQDGQCTLQRGERQKRGRFQAAKHSYAKQRALVTLTLSEAIMGVGQGCAQSVFRVSMLPHYTFHLS